MDPRQNLVRWRLVLGHDAEEGLGCTLDGVEARQDAALDYLYRREYGSGRNVRQAGGRAGSLDPSALSVPEWINAVQSLFPRRTIERLEKDALERDKIEEMVTNPELLKRAQPSQTLLKAVLHTKHLMNQEVLALARDLVRKVIEQLMEKLARPVRSVFLGSADRHKRSHLRIAKNFDARTTVRRNLAHFDLEKRRLLLQTPYFFCASAGRRTAGRS